MSDGPIHTGPWAAGWLNVQLETQGTETLLDLPRLQRLGQGWTLVSELESVISNAGDYPALSFSFSMDNVFCFAKVAQING